MNIAASKTRYTDRREQIEDYFDRTALDAWAKLTGDEPVSRVRATVRAGRETMRNALLGWLPRDLHGQRVLDAGCGTGASTMALASRGAAVVATDISPSLINLAQERLGIGAEPAVEFVVGDMLDPNLGEFDHVIAMDSLIHYHAEDVIDAVSRLCARARENVVFTIAPWTVPLALMHAFGRLLPRSDRAPDIVPVKPRWLADELNKRLADSGWRVWDSRRVSTGFYISEGIRLVRRA